MTGIRLHVFRDVWVHGSWLSIKSNRVRDCVLLYFGCSLLHPFVVNHSYILRSDFLWHSFHLWAATVAPWFTSLHHALLLICLSVEINLYKDPQAASEAAINFHVPRENTFIQPVCVHVSFSLSLPIPSALSPTDRDEPLKNKREKKLSVQSRGSDSLYPLY